jgi:hypothetical protein
VSALNLDQFVVEEAESQPETHPPVTQAEVERSVLRSHALNSWFSPHPTVVGAYHLWNEGETVPVTFDPKLFDQHPSTLRLLSYDEDLFQRLLEAVDAPMEHQVPPWIVRLTSDTPPLRVYYAATSTGAELLPDLAALEKALKQPGVPFDNRRLDVAQADFDRRTEELKQRDWEAEETRKKAEVVALQEQGRHLLLQATYIDLAMASRTGLFDNAPNLAGFSEDAVRALKRHGYPFAPLLKLVDTEGVRPDPTDAVWAKMQDASPDVLQKKFEAIKKPIIELIQRLVSKPI